MKLSVITVNYNNLYGLRETIMSVTEQTFRDFEYIIVDGNSTDGSKEYITEKNTGLWISEPDSGIYNAMNKGVRMAHGEYCLFMNSGDTFYDKNVLQKVLPNLTGGDFYVGHSILNEDGATTLRRTPQKMTAKFLLETSIMHQSTFIRTALLKDKTLFPENTLFLVISKFFHFSFGDDKCQMFHQPIQNSNLLADTLLQNLT